MKSCRREAGFSLAALIVFMTAVSILAAAAVPAYLTQARRELEEELIFRGEEYVRAILKYQRRFGIFPTSVEALLETDGIRFLRRAYVDPITGGEFRLITVNPDGSFSGSTLLGQGGSSRLPFGGGPQMFGGAGAGPAPSGPGNPFAGQRDGAPGAGQGDGGPGSQSGANPFPGGGPGSGASPFQGQAPTPGSSPFQAGGSGAAGQAVAGGIVGVAPANEAPSLKVYNQGETYDRWEFIALPGFGSVPGAGLSPVPGPGQGPDGPFTPSQQQ